MDNLRVECDSECVVNSLWCCQVSRLDIDVVNFLVN